MDDPPATPDPALAPARGRAAVSNRAGRFEPHGRDPFDDGWGGLEALADRKVETTVTWEQPKAAINDVRSPDVPFERSLNPYRGCEHGCIYCFARPTHAFHGLSPGLDFETKLIAKRNLAQLLRRELAGRRYTPRPIALGANTDPYQPVERTLGITRSVLEVLAETGHPFGIITKSAAVTRDIDLIAPVARQAAAHVSVSVTTLDPRLARAMEPRAANPTRRLAAIRALADAGIPVAVLASPMIPGLNDHELEAILAAGRDAGATMANTILVRLPLEIAPLFQEWLHQVAPGRADRVMSLIRQCRGGDVYDSRWGIRMRGVGPYADMLSARFRAACRRLGFGKRGWDLAVDQFRSPRHQDASKSAQLALL